MKLETISRHGGSAPDPVTLFRSLPLHRTHSYVFRDTEHAAELEGGAVTGK
jgi:O-acetylhomoserine (thiol)-lyase